MWNDAQKIGPYLNSEAGSTKRNLASFSPLSFPAREKRYGRRRHVRNDHDGTSRRKRRLLSSVLISSFPNRKLNLRFGFFHANLRQPLSQPAADSSPGRGALDGAHPPGLPLGEAMGGRKPKGSLVRGSLSLSGSSAGSGWSGRSRVSC